MGGTHHSNATAVSSADGLQAYATIKQALDTFKETKDKVNSQVDQHHQ